jgi:hypothetical protein
MAPPRNLRRFEHLERERPEARPDPQPADPAGSTRFEGLETQRPQAAPADAGPPPEPGASRFEPPVAKELALEQRGEADQPFVRCARCEADNTRFTQVCERCGAALDTPEQRVFNDALWAERREQQATEEAELEATRAVREEASVQDAVARRAYFEALAQQVGRQTRERLAADERRTVGFRFRGRAVSFGSPTADLAGFGGVAVVACVLFLAVGGCGALTRFLPVLGLLGAVAIFRWWVRR